MSYWTPLAAGGTITGMKTFSIDLMRLSSSGHGIVRIPTERLHAGDTIAVHDEDTDVFEATVLAVVDARQAEVQVNWENIIART